MSTNRNVTLAAIAGALSAPLVNLTNSVEIAKREIERLHFASMTRPGGRRHRGYFTVEQAGIHPQRRFTSNVQHFSPHRRPDHPLAEWTGTHWIVRQPHSEPTKRIYKGLVEHINGFGQVTARTYPTTKELRTLPRVKRKKGRA